MVPSVHFQRTWEGKGGSADLNLRVAKRQVPEQAAWELS